MNLEELSDDELNALDRRTADDLEASEWAMARIEGDPTQEDEMQRLEKGYAELEQLVRASHAERMRRRG